MRRQVGDFFLSLWSPEFSSSFLKPLPFLWGPRGCESYLETGPRKLHPQCPTHSLRSTGKPCTSVSLAEKC